MFIVDIYLFFFDAHKYFVKIIKYIRSIKYILFVFTVNNIDIYVRKYLNSYIKHIHIQMIIFNLIIYIFLYPYLLISFLQRDFTDYPSRSKYLAPLSCSSTLYISTNRCGNCSMIRVRFEGILSTERSNVRFER